MTRRFLLGASVLSVIIVSAAHFTTPVDSHPWHIVHLVFRKLYALPVLLAAASGPAPTLLILTAVSALFGYHVAGDWGGRPMEQTDQLGELISLWILALVAAPLFGRIRTYLAELEVAHEGTLQALISTIELREIETGQHCRRVRDYALMLAEQMGVKDTEFLSGLAQGALLHDIGKIGIPDSVLLKPGGLEPAERSLIETHPTLGADLVGNVRSLEAAKAVVLHHHERFDGEGYPSKLAGTAIPLSARIFSVADVFDAMTSSRPYRGQLPFPEVAEHLQQGAGLQFDPAVVEAFLKVSFHTWAQVARRHGLELKA